MGSPKDTEDRPQDQHKLRDPGTESPINQGGSIRDPPLGNRKIPPLKLTSNSGGNPYQEGGTSREDEIQTSKRSHNRESTRGSSEGGREKVAKGRTKKMAKAMER